MPSLRVNKALNSEIYFITCTVKVYSYDEAKQRILKRVADDEFVAYIEKYFDLESSGDEKVEKAYVFAGDTKVASLEITHVGEEEPVLSRSGSPDPLRNISSKSETGSATFPSPNPK